MRTEMQKRVIKFRCWNIDNKRWEKYLTGSFEIDMNQYKPWFVFQQFTGMVNKNGIEIYEGDVCIRNGHKRVIMFKDGAFHAFPIKSWQDEVDIDHLTAFSRGWFLALFTSDIEVIGNMLEHPDLLISPPTKTLSNPS